MISNEVPPKNCAKLWPIPTFTANAGRIAIVTRNNAPGNVILDKKFGAPTVTKDGVSVAKEIELKDPIENMGAQLVKEVASKTADAAGDGTTTATVLAQSIYGHGIKNVAAGANPMDLKRGIDKAVDAVIANLKKQSKPILKIALVLVLQAY